MVLGHRRPLRCPVDLGTGDIDEALGRLSPLPPPAGPASRWHHIMILAGRMDRVTHPETGEMKDHLDALHQLGHAPGVANVLDPELYLIAQKVVEVFAPAVDQVIDNRHAIELGRELARQLGADKAGTAGDQRCGAGLLIVNRP